MEPWDGPAGMIMTDSRYLLAKLDRNGLRPLRYIITEDENILVGSEIGTLSVSPEKVVESGRVSTGKILLIDLEEKRVFSEQEIENKLLNNHNYKELIQDKKNISELIDSYNYNKKIKTSEETEEFETEETETEETEENEEE